MGRPQSQPKKAMPHGQSVGVQHPYPGFCRLGQAAIAHPRIALGEIRVKLAALIKKRAVELARSFDRLAEVVAGNDAVAHHAEGTGCGQGVTADPKGFILHQPQHMLVDPRVLHRADLGAVPRRGLVHRVKGQAGVRQDRGEITVIAMYQPQQGADEAGGNLVTHTNYNCPSQARHTSRFAAGGRLGDSRVTPYTAA